MRRAEVHLSISIEYAKNVAGRRGPHSGIVILRVDSGRMHADGHEFHLSGDGVYLTEKIPVEYVESMSGDREERE